MSEARYIAQLRAHWRANPFDAHEQVFARRHEDGSPDYHRDMVEWFWNDDDRSVLLSFRGSGKSTRSEEFVTLQACYGAFYNCLLIGSSEARAAERLASISNELKMNEELRTVFGDLVGGDVWTQTKIVLRSGYCIQCLGREQDLRGLKHLDWRPDLIVVDDFEDKDNVLTPEGRRRTLRWFLAELLPACDPKRKVRVLGTPMDAESVPMLLIKQPRPGWAHRIYPIERVAEDGERAATWPQRFPLDWIDREKSDYLALGEHDVWEREFMCNAVSDASRVFRSEMIKVEPQLHTFQARWAMIDPARTVRRSSASTGWAVWSWERHRLVVWEAGAKQLLPDEIIDLVFRLCREYDPVELGVEEDGLNEWLIQPIRARAARDGAVPVRAVRAPRGKLDFVRGLQPFFSAGEVVFAREMPELRDQLLSFPTGRIDAPNALAYSLQLRPGRLIYEDWNPNAHIRPARPGRGPFFLAAHATRSVLGAVLCELADGRIRALADWLCEGDPTEAAETVLRGAAMCCGRDFTVVLGPGHFDQWNNVGLAQAFRSYGVDCRAGTSPDAGKQFLRRELARTVAGEPVFAVADEAHWTLRAFAGGYSRVLRDGWPSDDAQDNRYRVLMEGLESFTGLVNWGLEDETVERNWAFDANGRRFLSAMPARRQLNG